MKSLYNTVLIVALMLICFRLEAVNEMREIIETSLWFIPVALLRVLQDKIFKND